MTTDIRDCPPGTVPSWVLRFAYDGEEWLVLADQDEHTHSCDRYRGKTCADLGYREWRYAVSHFLQNHRCAECGALESGYGPSAVLAHSDSLAEARAAFERIEQEWRAAKEAVR